MKQLPAVPDWRARISRTQVGVTLVAALVFTAGLLTLSRPIAERLPDRFTDLLQPLDIESIRSSLLTVFGLTLVYISFELYRRKLAAWWLAFILLCVDFGLHLFIGTNVPQLTFSAILLIILLAGRKWFRSKVHGDNVWLGVRVLAASVAFAIVYGTIGFWLLDRRDFGVTFSLGQSFIRTLRSYLLIGNQDLTVYSRYGLWFLHSLAIVGGLSLLYGLFSLFRPLRARLSIRPGERDHARHLLERYGGETDDFFKLWPEDKSYFFSNDSQAFVAYGVANGIALCFAGPVGKPESISSLLTEFRVLCEENGWSPAFAQASDRFDKQLKKTGFDSLLIGADAVIDINKFLDQTVNNKKFRNIVNRFAKQEYRTDYYQPPHSSELLDEAGKISADWLKRAGRKEWRFFTGHYNHQYLQQTPLFVVRDGAGKMLAFVNQLPIYKHGEATIDLMRHRQDIPTNLMDWLFIELMKRFRQQSYANFNLGLSPLAAKPFADNPSDKLIANLYSVNQRIVSFKGLHQYKSKFEPDWQPRYLYYSGGVARLPQVGLAAYKLIRF